MSLGDTVASRELSRLSQAPGCLSHLNGGVSQSRQKQYKPSFEEVKGVERYLEVMYVTQDTLPSSR